MGTLHTTLFLKEEKINTAMSSILNTNHRYVNKVVLLMPSTLKRQYGLSWLKSMLWAWLTMPFPCPEYACSWLNFLTVRSLLSPKTTGITNALAICVTLLICCCCCCCCCCCPLKIPCCMPG